MPFIRRFSLFVERVVPERGSRLVRHLDPSVVTLPAVAVEAGRRALREVAASVLDQAHGLLTERRQPSRDKLDEATRALVDIRRFFGLIRGDGTTDLVRKRHISALHALDHLDRLCEAMEEAADAVHLDEPPSAERTDGEQPPRSEVYPGVDRTRRPSDPGSGSSGSARSE